MDRHIDRTHRSNALRGLGRLSILLRTGMIGVGNCEAEKAEVAVVLKSGIFDRSPALAQLLAYVCGKYFEGSAEELKEYTIAVEALHRPPEFDQKRDSVVRVQFHRLRERLSEYYQGEGAPHPIHIEIPQGQYVPRFLAAGKARVADVLEPVTETPARRGRWRWVAAVALIVAAAGGLFWASRHPDHRDGKAAVTPGAAPGSSSVRILVGLPDRTFTDGYGDAWLSDRYFEGGAVVNLPGVAIAGTRDPRLYQSRRQGVFRYDIPLDTGTYELRLYFAETFFGENNTAGYGGENSRAFGIQINGNTVMNRLDVVGEAGPSAADIKVFRDVSPAADGKLHLSFVPILSVPFLNAIEITPGTPGRLQPIRLVAQPRAYVDTAGETWLPDRFAIGGQLVQRHTVVAGAPDPALYTGERFGNLTYNIPVPPGRYSLSLYMAEQWLGPDMPGGGGVGSRLFDVLCNGVALVRNFDILARAGGSNRALVTTFHGLQPDHQGRLLLTLLPVRNFGLINAIEVTEDVK